MQVYILYALPFFCAFFSIGRFRAADLPQKSNMRANNDAVLKRFRNLFHGTIFDRAFGWLRVNSSVQLS